MSGSYVTSCLSSTAKKITDMNDRAREITWETFRRHIGIESVRETFSYYSYRGEMYNPSTGELTCPIHIKNDVCVSFWKSVYDGQPCYFIRHSAIEYIFMED